ncbi:hypothetical protein NFI96_013535 [Prochilodus magdalenae]|nr:hypothetical protein NFI96_013535 [Prochilodus magdalenae]
MNCEDKSSKLQEMMILLEQQKTELREKDKQLEEKEKLLSDRNTQLMEREKQVEEKDRHLEERNKQLQERTDPDSSVPARRRHSKEMIPPNLSGESCSSASPVSVPVAELRLVPAGEDWMWEECSRKHHPGQRGEEPDWSVYRPHAFLLVIPVKQSTGEERGMLEKMVEIFGERCWRNTMILFTVTDEVQEKNIEEFIQSGNQEIQRLVEKCGNRGNAERGKRKVKREEKGRAGEMEREIQQRNEVQLELVKLKEETEKERSEMEERHKQEMEEIRETYEGEARMEAERNLIKILLPELQQRIWELQTKEQKDFDCRMDEKEREIETLRRRHREEITAGGDDHQEDTRGRFSRLTQLLFWGTLSDPVIFTRSDQ